MPLCIQKWLVEKFELMENSGRIFSRLAGQFYDFSLMASIFISIQIPILS